MDSLAGQVEIHAAIPAIEYDLAIDRAQRPQNHFRRKKDPTAGLVESGAGIHQYLPAFTVLNLDAGFSQDLNSRQVYLLYLVG